MPSAAWVDNGTGLLINGEAGADIAFSVEGLANAAGRISAQIDLGVAPRAPIYAWSCEVQFQATPTQYGTLDLFIAEAPDGDNTQIAGNLGTSEAAVIDPDDLRNLKFIGSVVSEEAAASAVLVTAGEFVTYNRYISIVAWNTAGASVNATDSNFRFNLQPKFIEAQ